MTFLETEKGLTRCTIWMATLLDQGFGWLCGRTWLEDMSARLLSSWFMTRRESFAVSQGEGGRSRYCSISTPCSTSCAKQPPKATLDTLTSTTKFKLWGTWLSTFRHRHTHTHIPHLVLSWRLASAESWTTGCWSTCLKWVCGVLRQLRVQIDTGKLLVSSESNLVTW